jgi:hypothetical protein
MTTYKADVWLGSNSGFQTIEVNASSINGVSEQIEALYNIKSDKIRNIREHHQSDNADTTASGSFAGFIFLLLLVLIAFYPTITLTLLFGSSGAWITTKLSGKTFSKICEKENKKLYNIVLIVSLMCGGFGFYIGNNIQNQQSSHTK